MNENDCEKGGRSEVLSENLNILKQYMWVIEKLNMIYWPFCTPDIC